MRKAIMGAASALALASPAVAADLPVTPEVPSYERHTYEYRTAPPVVVEEPAPVVSETVIVRRPVIVAPPPVVVDEYPVYAAPRIYAAPPVYAYAGPVWRNGWGHRGLSAAVGEVSDMQGSTRGYFPTPDCDVRFGSKADIPPQKVMSALPPKADICSALAHVRYGPNTDIALFDHLVGAGEQRGRKT